MFSDAGGRSTEMEQRPDCPADCSKWWEQRQGKARPPMADSLADGTSRRCQQRNANQVDWHSG